MSSSVYRSRNSRLYWWQEERGREVSLAAKLGTNSRSVSIAAALDMDVFEDLLS
jgi:hypothetical protein